VRLNCLCE